MLLNAISVIVGLLGTIALSETMSFTAEKAAFGNSFTAFLMVVFASIILRYVYSRICLEDKRGMICAGLYSVGLSFALAAGKQLHTVENFAIGSITLWIQMFILAVFFFGLVLYLFQWIAKRAEESTLSVGKGDKINSPEAKNCVELSSTGQKKKEWKSFFLTWFLIFLCWIPVFLAFYPGAFVYDAQDEFVQVASREFTTHHPLTHVLLLGGCVCFGNKFLGSYNAGIALYTLFQMLVLSGIFAYTISYLRKYLAKKICIGITLFYGLFPVIPMYAVCSAKDTLFNGAFLLMLVQMAKLLENVFKSNSENDITCRQTDIEDRGKKAERYPKINLADAVLFVLASTAMMLLRNNGMMAYAVLLLGVVVIALFRWKKNRFWMGFAVMMLLSLVLYNGVDKTLAYVLEADDSESQEILTVPIQQLARTYKYSQEVFSREEKELLFSYIPEDILAIYDADLSDLVKVHFNNQKFAENPSEFWELWLGTFTKKPITYLNAWFMTSYGYWYPDTVINVYGGQQRFTFQYEDSSYFGFETEQPGERESKFPWLEEQYRRMSLELYQQNVPGISMLFSPGFLFWVFMGSFLLAMYRKQYLYVLPMLSILLLWATAILGPTFLVRYVLILWFAMPFILLAGCKSTIDMRITNESV